MTPVPAVPGDGYFHRSDTVPGGPVRRLSNWPVGVRHTMGRDLRFDVSLNRGFRRAFGSGYQVRLWWADGNGLRRSLWHWVPWQWHEPPQVLTYATFPSPGRLLGLDRVELWGMGPPVSVSSLTEREQELRDEAARRLGQALDVPQELLTGTVEPVQPVLGCGTAGCPCKDRVTA